MWSANVPGTTHSGSSSGRRHSGYVSESDIVVVRRPVVPVVDSIHQTPHSGLMSMAVTKNQIIASMLNLCNADVLVVIQAAIARLVENTMPSHNRGARICTCTDA
jgi:hypothetical protein